MLRARCLLYSVDHVKPSYVAVLGAAADWIQPQGYLRLRCGFDRTDVERHARPRGLNILCLTSGTRSVASFARGGSLSVERHL